MNDSPTPVFSREACNAANETVAVGSAPHVQGYMVGMQIGYMRASMDLVREPFRSMMHYGAVPMVREMARSFGREVQVVRLLSDDAVIVSVTGAPGEFESGVAG